MAAQQPVLGVGWMNFGSYYPSVRVAGATEEVQDPHNILVRAFAETGLIGGTLLVVWLMRMFWEMTCAGSSSASEGEDGYRATRRAGPLTWALGLGAGAMGVNLIAGHDFTQSDAWLQLQLFYCAGGALVLAATLAASAGRGWPPEWNREPCEWTIRGCVAGAGVFFLHNLLDFAWSEPGPLCLFALLAGAAIGAKSPPDHAPRVRPVVFFTGTLAALGLVLVMLGTWFATCVAENSASRADARVRALSANAPVDAMAVVARDYASAFAAMPLNADYLLREARIHIWRGDRAAARAACERAIAANPRQPLYHLFRAEIELANERPDPRIVSQAMESAISLDPRQASLRIQYGDALVRLGQEAAGRSQYTRALELDDALPVQEPRRLPAARRRELEKKAGR